MIHLVAGGIHAAALTHDNKILTWGANDEGVLGRDTFMEKKPVTDSDDEDDNEVEVNVKESTPTAVDASHFPENTVFTQLIALDSATFALTSTGQVYGWGCFRVCSPPFIELNQLTDRTTMAGWASLWRTRKFSRSLC